MITVAFAWRNLEKLLKLLTRTTGNPAEVRTDYNRAVFPNLLCSRIPFVFLKYPRIPHTPVHINIGVRVIGTQN
jgi:hypothetical protein